MRSEQLSGDLGGMNRLGVAGVVEFRAAAAEVGDHFLDLDPQVVGPGRAANALGGVADHRRVFPVAVAADQRLDPLPPFGHEIVERLQHEPRAGKRHLPERHVEAVEVHGLVRGGIVLSHPRDEFPIGLEQAHAVADPVGEVRGVAVTADVLVDEPRLGEAAFDGDGPEAVPLDEPPEESVAELEDLLAAVESLAEAEEFDLGDRRDHPVDALVGERDCVAGDPLIDGRVHGCLEAELGGGSDCGRLLRIARYRAR